MPSSTTPGRNIIFAAAAGFLIALSAAVLLNRPHKAQPPAFQPAANPYPDGIYAQGLIESDQTSGENVNIEAEVPGPVVRIFAREGDAVKAGQPLFAIDDSIQRASTEQLRLQAQAASAALDALKAQPRRETLEIAQAQLAQAAANLRTATDTRDKVERAAALDPRAVSRDALDQARDAAGAATASVALAQRQLDLTRAGAWTYDIRTQAAQSEAAAHAFEAANALLAKYVVKSPSDGTVLSINVAKGGYVSPQGVYETYSQGYVPAAVLSPGAGTLAVRCYVDEILLHKLPPGGPREAEAIVRGANIRVPLQFVRIQPYVSPKIELSNERQERVDLRVLPVIFRFRTSPSVRLYPGQLVDVYIRD